MVFTDNPGILSCMIKGNRLGHMIVNAAHRLGDECSCNCWHERVNTASNIADAQSREEIDVRMGGRGTLSLCQIFRSVTGVKGRAGFMDRPLFFTARLRSQNETE